VGDDVASIHLPRLQKRQNALARLIGHRFDEVIEITTYHVGHSVCLQTTIS
jgi:hypothetical protein